MAKSDAGDAIAAIAIGILGGIAAAAILSALAGEKCPVCDSRLIRGVKECPNCHAPLRWD